MIVWTQVPSIWKVGAAKVQGHPWHSEFEASLEYMRPCLKSQPTNQNMFPLLRSFRAYTDHVCSDFVAQLSIVLVEFFFPPAGERIEDRV